MNNRKFKILLGLLWITMGVYAQESSYRLCWKEDFNGKNIDEESWSKMPRGTADCNQYMSDDPRLFEVRKGKLILWGRVNDGLVPSDTARYLTAGIHSQFKRAISYGKVEVKARLHGAQGAWPAIWMLPNDGVWPNRGEIDLMERLNHESIAYQTVHSYYTYVLNENVPEHRSWTKINPDKYNVYAVEILPDKLIFSINGIKTFIYPKIETDKEGQFPFGIPFYLIIDMQIEGNWVGKADPSEYPVKMEVDWVKMYELIK